MPELVLALDLPDRRTALRLLDRLPALRWVKVGSILMTAEGPALVRELVEGRGLSVFLDLKWHDVPSTVARAVRASRGLGVSMATVHTLGGSAMMRAAAGEAGPGLALAGVTVLTSHTAEDFAAAIGKSGVSLEEEALRLARSAVAAGLAGVVCSPLEVAQLRTELGPGALLVVPGIRRPADKSDDQSRTAGPGPAARAGATHLVVGRPIIESRDPALALQEFLSAIP